MPEHYACWFLSPTDPEFKEIQVKFLKAQEKEYGASHYYGTDPFNEIQPPSWEPAYLADTARAIYGGMTAVDPEAVWLQMAWTFHNDHEHWTAPRLSAMIPPCRKAACCSSTTSARRRKSTRPPTPFTAPRSSGTIWAILAATIRSSARSTK